MTRKKRYSRYGRRTRAKRGSRRKIDGRTKKYRKVSQKNKRTKRYRKQRKVGGILFRKLRTRLGDNLPLQAEEGLTPVPGSLENLNAGRPHGNRNQHLRYTDAMVERAREAVGLPTKVTQEITDIDELWTAIVESALSEWPKEGGKLVAYSYPQDIKREKGFGYDSIAHTYYVTKHYEVRELGEGKIGLYSPEKHKWLDTRLVSRMFHNNRKTEFTQQSLKDIVGSGGGFISQVKRGYRLAFHGDPQGVINIVEGQKANEIRNEWKKGIMGAELKRLGCVVTPEGIDKLFALKENVDGVLEMVEAGRIDEFDMSSEDKRYIDDIPKTGGERRQMKARIKDEEDWKYFSQILEAARRGAVGLSGARDSAARDVEYQAQREDWGGVYAGRAHPDPERGPYPSKGGLLPAEGDRVEPEGG